MAETSDPGQPAKLIIDSDWKSQAQAEREKLAETEAKAAAKQSRPGAAGAAAAGEGEFPPPDFRGLLGMLATQALMYMGGMADRRTGQAIFDPEYSRHMIDLLGVLEEKTKGNLTPEETEELTGVLHELRMRYVDLIKLVAKQASAPGGPAAAAGPGAPGVAGPPMNFGSMSGPNLR
ncbi:MAG: DUF1844 domain-containing protein [Phycisphaerales bacterium]|nr:DUF1844 domain-containing protein [Phycisphaerales bacterium]